ncbi:hypothetical protein GN956_G280 [Arapaima gigas]
MKDFYLNNRFVTLCSSPSRGPSKNPAIKGRTKKETSSVPRCLSSGLQQKKGDKTPGCELSLPMTEDSV